MMAFPQDASHPQAGGHFLIAGALISLPPVQQETESLRDDLERPPKLESQEHYFSNSWDQLILDIYKDTEA